MSDDVEMNDMPLLKENEHGDDKKSNHDRDNSTPDVEIKEGKRNDKEEFTGLTKEELEKFANDPFWKKLRLVLFILFWVIWLGMLIVAILIVVFTPKCPTKPKLQFWQKKTGYWLDPYAFSDSDENGVGDFKGIIKKLDYIQKEIGAEYLIIDSIFSGQWSNDEKKIGLVDSFKKLDNILGKQNDLMQLIKECRKRGIEIVLSADFNGLTEKSSFWEGKVDSKTKSGNLDKSWKTREGKGIGNGDYSVLSGKIDLNLRDPDVIKELKDVVKMWLENGVMGLMLTNVPFYVENTTANPNTTTSTVGSEWFKTRRFNTQIFTDDTRLVLSEIKSVMNEIGQKTDKPRVLIADSGNIGFGSDGNKEEMTKYLTINKNGNEKSDLADMVMIREFLPQRGSTLKSSVNEMSSIENYRNSIGEKFQQRVGLSSASPNVAKGNDEVSLLNLAAPFLVPGSPILYYGSELGHVKCSNDQLESVTKLPIYPMNYKFPLADMNEEIPIKCNHLPMAWDNTGYSFSNTDNQTVIDRIKPYFSKLTTTVRSMTAIGRDEDIFQLTQKLIKLRKNEPSLMWGSIEPFLNMNDGQSEYQIYKREATGYPAIIVAFSKAPVGRGFSFMKICKKVTPLLSYPNNPRFDKEISADNIFLTVNPLTKQSLHIFKCGK